MEKTKIGRNPITDAESSPHRRSSSRLKNIQVSKKPTLVQKKLQFEKGVKTNAGRKISGKKNQAKTDLSSDSDEFQSVPGRNPQKRSRVHTQVKKRDMAQKGEKMDSDFEDEIPSEISESEEISSEEDNDLQEKKEKGKKRPMKGEYNENPSKKRNKSGDNLRKSKEDVQIVGNFK
ncbi:Unknown protein, partial [Striga hermonthica]